MSYEDSRRHCLQHFGNVSDAKIANWFNYCLELITVKFLDFQANRELIGGPGKIAQIDEAKFGRQKYHRGQNIENHCVIWMV